MKSARNITVKVIKSNELYVNKLAEYFAKKFNEKNTKIKK